MISHRYLPALALLLLLALVPTVIHQYLGLEEDDGLRVAAVPDRLAGYRGTPTDRRPAWGNALFGAHDWFERSYERDGRRIRLFVGRAYDQKKLYHHPEIALSRGMDLKGGRWQEIDGVPVHVMRPEQGRGVAAYVLLYDDAFVTDPVANQLRHAPWQLFNPRRSITLFYVHDSGLPADRSFAGSDAARLLLEAVRAFRMQSSGSHG